ncbi:MAG TPA: tetratricopeptide repeat protein [Thermoanaerobaculia bacterium]|jgi:tetratricopeptide (TPR) repeat protein|nr:tetratricopeptide repeat protein [Thermoanaerobaculia bacterium]
MKRSAFVLGVLVLLLPLSAVAQFPSADELLEKSLAAQQKGDYNGALQFLNQAVQAYPDSLPVRMRRLGFLEQIQGRGGSEDANRWIQGALVDDLRALARLAPDGREGGIARDALAKIEGRELFPAPKVSCPDGAAVAMAEAERLLNARKMRESIPLYKKAVELCPDEPVFWVHYADAYYALGEYGEARTLFEKGLAKAPWYAPGHRFLSDALAKSQDWEGGYHEAVLAVLSDPTYEAGWLTLRDFITGRDGVWQRAYGDKPQVKTDGGNVNLSLPADLSANRPDGPEWIAYGLFKVGADLPAPGEKKPAKAAPKTPLERERVAVLGVLETRRSQSAKPSPFWDMMDRAERAGFLDEAIYLHLLDEELVSGYREHREKNRERLVRYVETVLAPLPPRPKG